MTHSDQSELEPPSKMMAKEPVVVVAGATGFVGRALLARLQGEARIIGLTRSADRAARRHPELDVAWRSVDLFSMTDTEEALEGADFAVYLVHSMEQSARLTQASFADIDLLLADNFARAAAHANVQQIVYLGGISPADRTPSEHLRSRVEVERALASTGVPVTVARAGLVVGEGGSSLDILLKLVRRLPAMALPSWTRTPMTPIALDDVVEILARSVGDERTFGLTSDVGGPETMTYREMIDVTAATLDARRPLLPVPLLTPRLSSLWIRLVTGAPKALVDPLVESLRCPMVARDRRLQEIVGVEGKPFVEALRDALPTDELGTSSSQGTQVRRAPRERGDRAVGSSRRREPSLVRSVQRLPRPQDMTAEEIAEEYASWLPRFLWPLLRVAVQQDGVVRFHLAPLREPLLVLDLVEDSLRPGRHILQVTGGVLADTSGDESGRLEFREVLGGESALAAVHDFRPRLPWYIYRWSQAIAHLLVMRSFGRHLSSLSGEGPRLPTSRAASRRTSRTSE